MFLSLFTLLLLYSHFTTQQTSTKCACSVSVRLLFLGSFKEDFVTVPQSVNVCYLHADNAGADITDPEPMQQELNRQPDAASITDVHWHLCMNVVSRVLFLHLLIDLGHPQCQLVKPRLVLILPTEIWTHQCWQTSSCCILFTWESNCQFLFSSCTVLQNVDPLSGRNSRWICTSAF